MTPKEYKQMMDYLTRSGIKDKVKFASDVARPDPKPKVQEIELFNAFNRRNPRADGGRIGFYPGGSVEQFGQQIKDSYLKGKSIPKINKELFPNVDKTTTIDSFIDSAKKGLAPIKITKKELATRPVIKEGSGQATEAQKRLKTFVETFEKEKGRLPSSQELRRLGNFDFYTIKNAVDAGDVKILDPSTAARIAQQVSQGVNEQLLKLSESKTIDNIFKTGKTNIKDINKVKKVIGNVSNSQAATRLLQLASIYGEKGIEEDRGLNIKPKFKKNALKILESSPYKNYLRNLNEALIGKSVGEPSIKGAKSKIVQNPEFKKTNVAKLFDIDEPQGVASSVNRGSTPYGIFGQIIDANKNKIKTSWDGTKSKLEENVQKAISQFGVNSKEAKLAKEKYNSAATKVENNLNQGRLRGAKKITIPKMSFDAPKNTIANYKNFNTTYKKAFDDVFATQKYSFVIPKDLRTIPQLRKEVIDPNSSTYKQMINTLKKGFNEFDEKKLFDKINNATPDSFKKILRKIPRIASLNDDFTGPGGFPLTASFDPNIGIKSIEEDTFARRNPITTGAGLSAAGTAAVLKATGTPIKTALGKAFRGAGTRLGVLPFAAMQVKSNIDKGENVADAVVDPLVGLELSLPGVFKENLSKITKNPTAQRILNLGRFARLTTPVGLGITAAGLGIDAAKAAKKRLDFLDTLTPDQKTELFRKERQEAVMQNLRGERNAFDEFSAAGGGIAKLAGVDSGPPPESGPNSQGLQGLMKRVRNL